MPRLAVIGLVCLCWIGWPASAGADPTPDVAWDGTGALHAAISVSDPDRQRVLASFDGAPATPVWTQRTPAGRTGETVRGPRLAADAAGTVWLGWATYWVRSGGKETPSEDVYTSVWVARRAPGAPVQVQVRRLAGPQSGSPLLAVSPAGRVVVAWQAGRDRVALATGDAGGLGEVETIDVPVFALSAVGIDDAGRVVLAGSGANVSIEVVERAPDGGAGRATLAPGDGHNTRTPALAVNAAGDLVVAWSRYEPTTVMAAVRPAGGSFSAAAELGRTDGVVGTPQAGIDDAGRATVAWTTPRSGTDILTATGAVRDGLGPAEPIPGARGGGSPDGLVLAVGRDGGAGAAWVNGRPGDPLTAHDVVSRRPPGGAFGPPERLTAAGASRGFGGTAVAAGPAGAIGAAWAEFTSGNVSRLQSGVLSGAGLTARTLLQRPAGYYERAVQMGVAYPGYRTRLRGRRVGVAVTCYGPKVRTRCRGTLSLRVDGATIGRRRFSVPLGNSFVWIVLPRSERAEARRRGEVRVRAAVRYRRGQGRPGRASELLRVRG